MWCQCDIRICWTNQKTNPGHNALWLVEHTKSHCSGKPEKLKWSQLKFHETILFYIHTCPLWWYAILTSKIQASFAVARRLRRVAGGRQRTAAAFRRTEADDGVAAIARWLCNGKLRHAPHKAARRTAAGSMIFQHCAKHRTGKEVTREWVTTAISRKDLYLKSPSLRHDRVHAVVRFTDSISFLK